MISYSGDREVFCVDCGHAKNVRDIVDDFKLFVDKT
jgi:hypothetical protein